MKIAILTYHRSYNYGTILQGITTRVIIQNLGHEVSYIDYWPDYHCEAYKLFSLKRLKKAPLAYLKSRIMLVRSILNRIKQFDKDINEYIRPYCIPYNMTAGGYYDCVVYGSDQAWRRQVVTNKLSPVYFGQNEISVANHITYVASMDNMIETIDEKLKIKSWTEKIDAISVRESELQTLVNELGSQSELVLDLILLISSDQWDSVLYPEPLRKPGYILYYSLNIGAFYIRTINEFARLKGLKVIEIKGTAGYDSDSVISQCRPRGFVSLIKNAECVFTTSYDGLLFLIIYRKEFYTSFVTNAGRAKSILNIIKQSNRLVQPCIKEVPVIPKINYDAVEDSLKLMKNSLLIISKKSVNE